MNKAIAKAGSLLCVDQGEYSDYTVMGFFVVLRDFSPKAALEEHLATNPEQRENYRFSADAFLADLLRQGLLLEVSYATLHLGGYGHFAEVSLTPWAPENEAG